MIFIILTVFYLLCVILSWKFFHKHHSKGGEWYGLNPTLSDLFFTITPLFNIFPAIDFIKDYFDIPLKSFDKMLIKFYKIKQ